MKNLFRIMPKKSLATVAAVLTVFGVAASVHAWSPDRPTYTLANPSDHVTFNSITDNPREGDERAFFEVKNAANTASDGFLHSATVTDGEELLLRVYVHNDAADNLNTVSDGKGGFVGIATNTKLRISLPTVTSDVMRLNAYVSADNAAPAVVADTLDLAAQNTNQNFSVSYVAGSAVAYNNAHTAKDANGNPIGMPLSDSIVSSGAALGYETANGMFPGCFQYVNVVTVKVKVHLNNPAFSVEKYVANVGDAAWSKTVTSKPADKVHYELRFRNTGNTTLGNVVARDVLPKNVKLVPGTVKLYNNNFPGGTPLGDGVVSDGGANIAAYGPLTATQISQGMYSALVDFDATLPATDALQCGANKLTNVGEFLAGGQNSTDTADVIVNKVCTETPAFSCDLFDVTKGDNRTVTVSQFKETATGGAVFNRADINWGDNTTKTMTDNIVGQKHQYSKDGTYNIAATTFFTVNGKEVSTSGSCRKSVTFSSTVVVPPSVPENPGTVVVVTAAKPTVLVNTGPGEVVGMFAAVAAVSTFAYSKFLGRRLSN